MLEQDVCNPSACCKSCLLTQDPQVTCNMAGFCGGKDTQELRHKFSDMKNFAMVVLRKVGISLCN